ncbi:hypothetical protein TNIN_404221 [Trichonephila inaurata madagascariensis]|uniref:Uncharacterized protein n=1 Tax=Trichonephila inaurata madagascariensis TaxID=2747483 RepID=A0A8X6MBP4_9ARAC|nr:hypothetical protein TNIN_404221 [Trichonephila inaurata madagascariensis]
MKPGTRAPEKVNFQIKTVNARQAAFDKIYLPAFLRTTTDPDKCHTQSDTNKKPTGTDTPRATPDNDKCRKQKGPKKKAANPPPTVHDQDRCRLHNELKKDINMMNRCLAYLEHCIRSEKEFPDDANLADYQNDYDDLVSLKKSTKWVS